MGIEIIKENNGEQLIEYKLPKFINENINNFSNNSDDYEILQSLGKGGFGAVFKVKSKTNFGIYAMKKIDMSFVEQKANKSKYYENEILLLKKLNHPNIIKCYNVFKENNYLYLIMEFMDNGDLKNYNEGIIKMNKQIEEGKLWEIFYKCLSGLNYIHGKHIIHRDIKLENIFLDENFNVKLGDFNASAVTDINAAKNFAEEQENIDDLVNNYTNIESYGYKAPEIGNKSPYGPKIDIYSMGASFYELCYGHIPYKFQKLKDNEGAMYSKELKDFINKMIEKDPSKRPTSNEAMTFAKNYFIKNYVKNTSIESTMNCFNNFPNFNSFFSDTFNINIIKELKREISRLCGEVIQSMNSKNFSKVKSDLFDLRKQLEKEGLNIKNYDKEIDPGIFIFLFIRKLNSELNEILSPNTKISNEEKIKRYKILSRRYSFSPNEIESSFNLLINTYNKKILSFISRNFFSYIKITKTCLGCNHSSCYFDKLYFIPINIKILKQKIGTIFNICLKDAFNSLKNSCANISTIKAIECNGCKKISEFKETKRFYHIAKNLIIIFDRGENMKEESFIDFDDNLCLNSNEVERYKEVHYELKGIITKIKEDYISLIRQNNNWISSKGEQFNLKDAKKLGTVIALFYYSDENILILESQDKKNKTEDQNEQSFLNNNNNNKNNNNINNNNKFRNQNQFMMNNINNQQQNFFNQINNNPQNNNKPMNNFSEINNNINNNANQNNLNNNNNNNFVSQNFNNFDNYQNNINNNFNMSQMSNNGFSYYNNNFNQINNNNNCSNSSNNFSINNLQQNNGNYNSINNNSQNFGNQIHARLPLNNFNNINGYNNNLNNLYQNNIMNNKNNFDYYMGNSNYNPGMNNMRRFNNF